MLEAYNDRSDNASISDNNSNMTTLNPSIKIDGNGFHVKTTQTSTPTLMPHLGMTVA